MSRISTVQVDRLVSCLRHASLDAAGWKDFASELDRSLGGTLTSLHGVDGASKRMFSSTAGLADPAAVKSFIDYYYAKNPFSRFAVSLRPECVSLFSSMIPDGTLLATEFYNDWMRPNGGLFGGVGMKTSLSGRRSLVVSIIVQKKGRDLAEAEAVRLLRKLMPHVSHAYSVSEALAGLSSRLLTATVPDCHAPDARGGIIVTDATRMLAWADEGAFDLCGTLIKIDPVGRVKFIDPSADEWATEISRCALSGDLNKARLGTTICVGKKKYNVLAALPSMEAPTSPMFPAIFQGRSTLPERQVAFLILCGHEASFPTIVLNEKYQLTAAEAAVAVLVHQGQSTREIAEARQVSVHTVRNQIRVVLDKMDARHRSDVTRLVMQALAVKQR